MRLEETGLVKNATWPERHKKTGREKSGFVSHCNQGCQIFLRYNAYTKTGVKYTKLPINYQMAITIFHSKALQNSPKLGFLV
jgi:hypothetical protein